MRIIIEIDKNTNNEVLNAVVNSLDKINGIKQCGGKLSSETSKIEYVEKKEKSRNVELYT